LYNSYVWWKDRKACMTVQTKIRVNFTFTVLVMADSYRSNVEAYSKSKAIGNIVKIPHK